VTQKGIIVSVKTIEQVKAEFLECSKPLALRMGEVARAYGMQHSQYEILSNQYAIMRKLYGIKLQPKAPCGWEFIDKSKRVAS